MAVSKTVPLEIQGVGNVEAFSTVTVKAQVGGELTQVNFQEGSDVKKGDRLFVIDPRPYQSQVAQANANLAKDRAQLQVAQANLARDAAQEAYAQSQSKRYSELLSRGVASKDSTEQSNSQAAALREALGADNAAIESARANIAADETALDRAKLQLEYCTIASPINGRTGHLLVKQGNVIKVTDEDLVTINQLQPIFVTFAVPEESLPTIQSHMTHGKVSVAAYSQSGDAPIETGTLTFVENTVDSTTGTIRLKALFDNPHSNLWPGAFVRVVVQLNELADAIVVPVPAVQTGQDGKFVFVVKPDMTVDARPVTTGRVFQKEIVVQKGLSGGETVVTEGQLRLVPGSRVQVK
jgi:multidrug efflux system membrane fusion protein